MKDKDRKTVWWIAGCVILIILVTILGILSGKLRDAKRRNRLVEDAQIVLGELGEKGFFDLVGIPTDELEWKGTASYPGPDRGAWTYSEDERVNISVYGKCAPSVVQILANTTLSSDAQGSGVVISTDGYILTNSHVLGKGEQYVVNFYDGTTANATLVGVDRLTDIAVLKVERKDLTPISATRSEPVVGEKVLAIGNPFGYTWSLTTGIVSGLGRSILNPDGNLIPDMIQTDALINPGNSGGPLLNSRGEMIGLVSSIYSTTGSSQGISFALPVDVCSLVANEIIENGRFSRGWIDILSVELNPQIVDYLKLPVDKGIIVSQTVPGGNADKGGLKGGNRKAQYGSSVIYLGGDVILEIDGKRIENYSDYFEAMFQKKAGDKVDILVYRGSGTVLLKDVVLVEQTSENTRWILR